MGKFSSEYRGLLGSGLSSEAALGEMRNRGATPIEAIRAIAEVQGSSLEEAKKIFASSPAWRNEVKAADELHEELLTQLRREKS